MLVYSKFKKEMILNYLKDNYYLENHIKKINKNSFYNSLGVVNMSVFVDLEFNSFLIAIVLTDKTLYYSISHEYQKFFFINNQGIKKFPFGKYNKLYQQLKKDFKDFSIDKYSFRIVIKNVFKLKNDFNNLSFEEKLFKIKENPNKYFLLDSKNKKEIFAFYYVEKFGFNSLSEEDKIKFPSLIFYSKNIDFETYLINIKKKHIKEKTDIINSFKNKNINFKNKV